MEVSTEINKVFGQEMAKLFAATVSEDEMMAKARGIWKDMNASTNSWGYKRDSELESYIKKEFLKEIQDRVKEILAEPRSKEEVEKRAREIVAESRRIGEEAIIKAMAERMLDNVFSSLDNGRFVSDVMRCMCVEADPCTR